MNLNITITRNSGRVVGETSIKEIRELYKDDGYKIGEYSQEDLIDSLIDEIKGQIEQAIRVYDIDNK